MEKHIEYRNKILDFLMETPDEFKDLGDIKEILGLEPMKCNGWLDKALRTVRIETEKGHSPVMIDGKHKGHWRVPLTIYKIADKERARREKQND